MIVSVFNNNSPAPMSIDFEVAPRVGEKVALPGAAASGDGYHVVIAAWHEVAGGPALSYAIRVAA